MGHEIQNNESISSDESKEEHELNETPRTGVDTGDKTTIDWNLTIAISTFCIIIARIRKHSIVTK